MRFFETVLGGFIAFIAGAGLMRMWDHRPREPQGPGTASQPSAPRQAPHFAKTFDATRFVRGNLHTHTTLSDGDATPFDVARWYESHGYGFLAMTDHNLLSATDPAAGTSSGLLLVPGEEITMRAQGLPVHVNALCTQGTPASIPGGTFERAIDALEYAIAEVHAQGGVALVNHPNFDRALTTSDVESAPGEELLEIASGHPYVGTLGDKTHLSHEQLWDAALTAGHDVMGVGVDDVHHLVTDADPEAFPGRAWVSVFADEARIDLVCDALRRGALYASTGAELRRIEVTEQVYRVEPVEPGAHVSFVGSGGRVLAENANASASESATYVLKGDEGYVRARVESAAGYAWTPAVRVVR